MDFFLTVSCGVFILSLLVLLVSIFGTGGCRRAKKCTQSGIAIVEKVCNESRSDSGVYFKIRYRAGGKEYSVNVPLESTEGIPMTVKAGEEVPVFYCPDKPETVIISADREMKKSVKTWKTVRKAALILMAVSLTASVILFWRS